MTQKSTIAFLLGVVALLTLLLILITKSFNQASDIENEERKKTKILQEIIDKTENKNSILNEGLIGKTIIINVWDTWCQPCWKEMPELNQLVEKYANDDIIFIALSESSQEKAEEALKEKNQQFNYQLFYKQQELINLLYTYKLSHEIDALPLHLVINKEGKIEFYFMGYDQEKMLSVKNYLKEL